MTCGRPWAEQHERQDRALTGLATAVLERAAAQLGERVLDIGCGAGTTVLALAVQVGPNGYVLGAHISQQSVARARERIATAGLRRVEVISADVAPSRMRYTRAGSAQANMPGSCGVGGVIGGSRWRTASSEAFGHGFSRGARNTASATRPPGFIARRTFAEAAIGSSKNITPRRENARLKLPAAKAWVLPAERHGAVRAALERFFQSHATQQGVVLPAAFWVVQARA
jgi:SAM-dependent methyltransferase